VTTKDKERLALGALWLLSAAAIFAGRNGRFGDTWNHSAWFFSALCTGWLLRSFLPVPEKPDAITQGITITLYLIVIVTLVVLVGLIGAHL
jgi:hypothetical protein